MNDENRQSCAYVHQDDALSPLLTVQETVMFHAHMRLPSSMSWKEKQDRVRDHITLSSLCVSLLILGWDIRLTLSLGLSLSQANAVISKLGLEGVRNSRIGDEYVRGVSGGERRRVSIAVEMVSNPGACMCASLSLSLLLARLHAPIADDDDDDGGAEVLFLDEPTSGLDAKTSLNLAMTLSDLAHNHGHTVVCTIHQPRSQIFEQFDYLMLLVVRFSLSQPSISEDKTTHLNERWFPRTQRGHIVYYGEASRALDHFESLGYPCPVHENPADFFSTSTIGLTSTRSSL